MLYLFRNLHVVFNVRVLLREKQGNKTINCRGVVEEDVKPMSIEYRKFVIYIPLKTTLHFKMIPKTDLES